MNELKANFVDGLVLKIDYKLQEGELSLLAFDSRLKQRFEIRFSDIRTLRIDTPVSDSAWCDLSDGLSEITSSHPGWRTFRLHFDDDGQIVVTCLRFNMEAVEGGPPTD